MKNQVQFIVLSLSISLKGTKDPHCHCLVKGVYCYDRQTLLERKWMKSLREGMKESVVFGSGMLLRSNVWRVLAGLLVGMA